MDVIAMQTANKVLKRMNTQYNGMLHKAVATAGQTAFILPKQYAPGSHTLEVYVDGIKAVLTDDYLETNNLTVTFTEGRELGQVVTFQTQVAGVPVTQIANPAYDDAVVKEDIDAAELAVSTLQGKMDTAEGKIVTLEEQMSTAQGGIEGLDTRLVTAEGKVTSILSVLDADSDGSIVDALSDLKAQWEDADGDLTALISNKAETSTVTSLSGRVTTAEGEVDTLQVEMLSAQGSIETLQTNEGDIQTELIAARNGKDSLALELQNIRASIPLAYDETDLSGRVTDLETVDADTRLGVVETELANAKGAELSLAQKLTAIQNSIPAAYDDAALESRVDSLEVKPLSSYTLTDTVTGWSYKLQVVNGTLTADLAKKLLSVMMSRVGNGTIYKGDSFDLTASALYEDTTNATGETTFSWGTTDALVGSVDNVTGHAVTVGEGVLNITLTGVNKGIQKQATVGFTVVLSDTQIVAKAVTNLTLGDLSAVTGNLTLPDMQDGAVVMWATDNDVVVTASGVVARPLFGSGNAVVTLTATITMNAANDTKTFEVTVLEMPE